MNYDELSEWCIQNRDLPDVSITSFVVSYQINIDGDDAENFPDSVATVENPHYINSSFYINSPFDFARFNI